MPFCIVKGHVLMCKRASFRMQKGVDGEVRRKEVDKKERNSEGRRPPKYGLPKPLQGEGMYLAGYVMLGVGEIEG